MSWLPSSVSGSVLLFAAVAATMVTVITIRFLVHNGRALGIERVNFQGTAITGSLGVAIAAGALTGYVMMVVLQPGAARLAAAFALVATGTAILGLVDDQRGSRAVGGFRGHFGELIKGRVTTGAIKALLLPLLAYGVAANVMGQGCFRALLSAVEIALWANLINLLDIRPGRAVTASLAGGTLAAAVIWLTGARAWPLAVVTGPALAYLPWDASRRGMLGDAGANLLGALVGLQFAAAAPAGVQAVVLMILAGIHIYSEKNSLGAEIDRRRWLRWLDFPARVSWPELPF